MRKVLLLNRAAFIKWFFDWDIMSSFCDDYGVIQHLVNTGKFQLTAEQILEGVGYLSEEVVEDGQDIIRDEFGEVDMSAYDEIIFSNK